MTRSFDECLELTRYRSYCWWVYLSVSWLAMDQLDCVDWDWCLLYLDAFGERNIRPSPPSPANQENAERHRRSSLVVPIRPSADGPSNAEDELDPSSSDAILRAYLVIDIHLKLPRYVVMTQILTGRQCLLESIHRHRICRPFPMLRRVPHRLRRTPRLVPKSRRTGLLWHWHWDCHRRYLGASAPKGNQFAPLRPKHKPTSPRSRRLRRVSRKYPHPDWRILVRMDGPAVDSLDPPDPGGSSFRLREWSRLHLLDELHSGELYSLCCLGSGGQLNCAIWPCWYFASCRVEDVSHLGAELGW